MKKEQINGRNGERHQTCLDGRLVTDEGKANILRQQDKSLRDAIRQDEAELPQMPSDLNDRLMLRLEKSIEKENSSRFSSLSIWRGRGVRLALTAAASVALLLTIHYYNNSGVEPKEMPLAEAQTVLREPLNSIEQPDGTAKAEEKPQTTMTVQKTPVLAQKTPSKSPQKDRVRKAKATQPKPTNTTEELVTHLENDELHLTAEASPQVTITRTIHLSPEQVIYIVDASNQMPAMEMLSVNELRMRGQRLTAEVQQHLQNPM